MKPHRVLWTSPKWSNHFTFVSDDTFCRTVKPQLGMKVGIIDVVDEGIAGTKGQRSCRDGSSTEGWKTETS
jgi:hypothetical protein